MNTRIVILAVALVVLAGGIFWYAASQGGFSWVLQFVGFQQAALVGEPPGEFPNDEATSPVAPEPASPFVGEAIPSFAEPIAEFEKRITKKPFGIHITPETSPVPHDRFAGYHTGVDVEYEDVVADVPVRAIADGEVIVSTFASGYGGVVVLRHNMFGEEILGLYGHLDPASLASRGKEMKKSDVLGILGEGYTKETDGVRKHLHFAILRQNSVDLRGYVKDINDLTQWYDPLSFYLE